MSFLQRLPFILHTIVEIPASLNFFFNPSSQLSTPAPQAHAVIQQYALLLFVSSLISILFAWRPVDRTSRNVAGALSLYHIAPTLRAAGRILRGDGFGKGAKALGGQPEGLGYPHPAVTLSDDNGGRGKYRVPLQDMMNLASIYAQDEGMRTYVQVEEASFRAILSNETSPEPKIDQPTVFNFFFDDLSPDAPDYKIYAFCTKYLRIVSEEAKPPNLS
ncbi:hypothetical protein DSL72_007454 [Monilinia vaccinii-corymbosi]|uniref:Uncharacterized protein n=1 Tax=Monilinia vaccinii-corymbosi TaxID=61207 RepID=A0A8A3PLV0_9HELO|nr:hypothetical protein DSL72_007454 [Monilinia vaccinii-corymbosi]